MKTYTNFDTVDINPVYVNALAELIIACRICDVQVKRTQFYQNGFRVEFDVKNGGDAIIHDGSYGRNDGTWETIGFPWDGDDVSCHDPFTLTKMLAALKKGRDWSEYECD